MAKEPYNHRQIEKDAQEKWARLNLYSTDLGDTEKESYYLLSEFPYPSGELHTGHWYAFALPDIYARYLRMNGKNVLFPMGFDAFGLPAENAAIRNGIDPKEWTYANMDRMRTQFRSMGTSLDWSKEVVTCDPGYYKWTQWLFSKLFEHGLAERKKAAVKWCPKDQTVLANEQVINGHCERCGTEVEEKILTQWFLTITKYAKRLLDDLEPLPWPKEIKDAQRAWIGESEGAKIFFDLRAASNDDAGTIEVFTTRPDTIYGATYVVLAPEHPLLDTLLPLVINQKEVEEYRVATSRKTERERSENKEKTGIKLEGLWAMNPANQIEIPIYIADYVLASYGTGAVMAVPAHDERDFEFAQKHKLPIVHVVEPKFVADPIGEAAVRPDEEIIKREAICAIVRNPKDDTYLCISWKDVEMHGLVTGGIEEGEDIIESARREVLEETGYKNLQYVERPPITINTFFYHRLKKQNRWAHFHYVFFDLENEERDPIPDAEAKLHDVVWKKKEELKTFFTVFEGDFIVQILDSKEFVYTAPGILTNSGSFTGSESESAKWDIVAQVAGERVTNYRIRDWLVSRQRYWGCPIPIVYDPEGNPRLIPAENLPWLLPTDIDFTSLKDTGGKSPLAQSKELNERVERIFGKGWTPEYDTLDTFVDSSWYFLRYLDALDDTKFSEEKTMKHWLPINRYSGGAEHTTMHLLYSRFFQKALFDLALVPTNEPFAERLNRGLILGPDGHKMSKSKGNVINPDEFVEKYGADAMRVYLAFIGPYNEPGQYPWNLDGIAAMRRFLDRIAKLSGKLSDDNPNTETIRSLSIATGKVSNDIERFKFNTALSALMILLNTLEKLPSVPRKSYQEFLKLAAPFAPHLTDYLFAVTGGLVSNSEESIHTSTWPQWKDILPEQTATVVVQVNGKRKGDISLSPEASEEDALTAARTLPAVHQQIASKELKRIVYIPGRILNIVV